jgi:hypothetical protein
MLVAAIFLILLLSTVAAYIMRKRHINLPRVWILMAAVSILLWLIIVIIPHDGTVAFTIKDWFSSDVSRISLTFAINPTNWAIVFTLLSVHIAFLFVSGSKQELNRDFIFWVLEAGQIILAYIAVTAADLWTVIIAWTAMDFGSLVFLLFMHKEPTNSQVITPLFFKLLGSLLLIYATAISSGGNNQILLLTNIPAASSGLFFAAAILHCGVLPFRFPRKEKTEIGTVTGLFFYLIPFISSLFLVVYLPYEEIPFLSYILLSIFSIAGMYYFGLLWTQSRDEGNGIYYLTLAFTAFTIFRFITGTHQDLVPWLVLTLLGGCWMMLFSHRGSSTRFLPVSLLISMMGIPFTLTSYGSSLFFADGFKFSIIFVLMFQIIYLLGFYSFLTSKKEQFDELDSSSQLNYLIAILFSVLAILLISYRSSGSLLNEISNWWACLPAILALAGYYLWKRRKTDKSPAETIKTDQPRIDGRIAKILSFNWLITTATFIAERLRPIANGFSNLMEGEGGILWSIVFMALLVTLLRTG